MNFTLTQLGLRVTDLAASQQHFGGVLALEPASSTAGCSRLGFPGCAPSLVLIADAAAGCDHIVLQTDERTLDQVVRNADARSVPVEPPDWVAGEGVRLSAPNGLAIEVGAGEVSGPNTHRRGDGPLVAALDHVALSAKDLGATMSFFLDVLGFRLSDSVEDKRHWLRCNTNHHTIALFGGSDSLHHYAFVAADPDELVRVGDRLAARDQNFLWGIGRHGIGANIFSYHLDADGAILEVCADMLQIDEMSWTPEIWSSQSLASAVRWGPPPPDGFRDFALPIRAGRGRS